MNLENITFSIEYVVIAILLLVLYLLYFIFTKDAQYSKNIRSIASVVEDLNREVYYLKKKIEQLETGKKDAVPRMSDEEIYQEIERSVYDLMQPVSKAIGQLQENIEAVEHEVETRVSQLESGVKQISIPSSIHGNDDEKIISLYRQGVSIETIAKELHLAKPEVEFVLKINKIK